MVEKYKGYSINTEWNDNAMGFDFSVRSEGGAEVFRSEEAYFYEENALVAEGGCRLQSGRGGQKG